MAMSELDLRLAAVERYFQNARQAEINDYWARITGKNCSLLKYEVVANHLHLRQQIPVGHQMVPLRNIVGSVGRYREFTKDFLPRRAILQDRWVAVDVTLNSLRGLPPVELYKIGEAYFVVDGNHRISVAHANGNKDIEAKVIEWQTPIHFTVEDFESEQWLIKAAHGEFLAQTKLHQWLPGVELTLTNREHYETLLQHIAVHRYLSNQPRRDMGMAMGWGEAVTSWYQTVYTPIVEAMRAHKLQTRFPKRTATDLYIAITQNRERIAEAYALAPLDAETAVKVFAADHSDRLFDQLCFVLCQTITHRLHWGQVKTPAGMTAEEFDALRLRHAAGELSLTEAERKATQDRLFTEPLCEGSFSAQFSG